MINVSPVGRNASQAERDEFEKWDKENNCRPKMIEAIKKEFGDIGMVLVLIPSNHFHPLNTNVYSAQLTIRSHQLLHRRPNLLRRLPLRLGQNILPPTR